MPFCNGMERSRAFSDITPRESGQTSLWSFLTREFGKPAKEEKQMTTENSVGAASNAEMNRPPSTGGKFTKTSVGSRRVS